MVKPLALLLAAALLALAHAQKYATPQEAKAEMCRRGIFQEGGDTAGFIDCSMVSRRGWRDLAPAHNSLGGVRAPPQLPHPCSLFLLNLLRRHRPPPTYNPHPHVHCARPYAALGPSPRAHPLYYPSPSLQRRGAAVHTSPARADAPSSPPSHPASAPHQCVRCTFEPPAPARPLPPRSIV